MLPTLSYSDLLYHTSFTSPSSRIFRLETKVMDEVKLLFKKRQYKNCSARCIQILDGTTDLIYILCSKNKHIPMLLQPTRSLAVRRQKAVLSQMLGTPPQTSLQHLRQYQKILASRLSPSHVLYSATVSTSQACRYNCDSRSTLSTSRSPVCKKSGELDARTVLTSLQLLMLGV